MTLNFVGYFPISVCQGFQECLNQIIQKTIRIRTISVSVLYKEQDIIDLSVLSVQEMLEKVSILSICRVAIIYRPELDNPLPTQNLEICLLTTKLPVFLHQQKSKAYVKYIYSSQILFNHINIYVYNIDIIRINYSIKSLGN